MGKLPALGSSHCPDRSATIPRGLKFGVRSRSRGSDGAVSTEGRGQVRPTPEEPVWGPRGLQILAARNGRQGRPRDLPFHDLQEPAPGDKDRPAWGAEEG